MGLSANLSWSQAALATHKPTEVRGICESKGECGPIDAFAGGKPLGSAFDDSARDELLRAFATNGENQSVEIVGVNAEKVGIEGNVVVCSDVFVDRCLESVNQRVVYRIFSQYPTSTQRPSFQPTSRSVPE